MIKEKDFCNGIFPIAFKYLSSKLRIMLLNAKIILLKLCNIFRTVNFDLDSKILFYIGWTFILPFYFISLFQWDVKKIKVMISKFIFISFSFYAKLFNGLNLYVKFICMLAFFCMEMCFKKMLNREMKDPTMSRIEKTWQKNAVDKYPRLFQSLYLMKNP